MPELLQVQRAFYASIFQKDNENLNFISSSVPKERFNVYRQTIFENMRNALHITFPGTWKLLGEECANSVAYAFCQMPENLLKTGCLDDLGDAFPSFLGSLKELKGLPYIKDYASYEWLQHLTYGAKEVKVISPVDLQNIPESQVDSLTFTFVPSCSLFTSPYPISDIQEVVENDNADPITLSHQDSYGVIVRMGSQTHTFWVSKALWGFINSLMQKVSLSKSAEQAQAHDPEFDLTSTISFMLQKQLIHTLIYRGGTNID